MRDWFVSKTIYIALSTEDVYRSGQIAVASLLCFIAYFISCTFNLLLLDIVVKLHFKSINLKAYM
jgi:hypothetical protein